MSKPGSQDPIDNHGSSPQLSIRSADPFPAGNMYFQQQWGDEEYTGKCNIQVLWQVHYSHISPRTDSDTRALCRHGEQLQLQMGIWASLA